MHIVDVKMDEVELLSLSGDQLDKPDMVRKLLPTGRLLPERPGTARNQPGGGLRIAAGEQRDLVPLPDKLLGQVRDNPLCPAIELWRNALEEWSDLRDAHGQYSQKMTGDTGSARALVVHPSLRQASPVFLKVADLDQCRPEFDGALDRGHHVVHGPQQVLVEEVWLEAVEGLLQVGRDQTNGIPSFGPGGSLGRVERTAVE